MGRLQLKLYADCFEVYFFIRGTRLFARPLLNRATTWVDYIAPLEIYPTFFYNGAADIMLPARLGVAYQLFNTYNMGESR